MSNAISEAVIGAAIRVHQEIGPGKLESTYDACLAFELIQRGRKIERQRGFPITYRGQRLDCGYRVDLIVDGLVIGCQRVPGVSQVSALSAPSAFSAMIAITGAWSLVPTSFCTGHSVARAARASLTIT